MECQVSSLESAVRFTIHGGQKLNLTSDSRLGWAMVLGSFQCRVVLLLLECQVSSLESDVRFT